MEHPASPPFGGWTRSRRIGLVVNAILAVLVTLMAAAPLLVNEHEKLWLFYAPHVLGAACALVAMKFGRPHLAIGLGVGMGVLGLATSLLFFGGISSYVGVGFPILVALAGVLWSLRAAIVTAVASAIAIAGAGLAEHFGRLPARIITQPLAQSFLGLLAALAVMLVIVYLINRLSDAAVENALRTKDRFTSLVEQSPDALVFMDEDSRVQFMNPSAARLCGYSREELVGLRIDELPFFPPPFRPIAAKTYFDLLRGGPEMPPRDVEIIAKDGTHVLVEVNRCRVILENGTAGLQYTIRDVGERRRNESLKVKWETRLLEAQKMESIGQLAGGVAHDFNNLLTVILGQSELLLYQNLSERAREQVRQVIVAGERAKTLTHQLLAFARKQMLAPKEIDPNSAIHELDQLFATLVGKRIKIELDLDPRCGRIRVDPSQFGQVLTNLLGNARDAIPGEGRITISTRRSRTPAGSVAVGASSDAIPLGAGFVVIAVADTGQGMDEATRKRIFEPFFTTKQNANGTGLGLAVVDGVVSQHGGHIEVISEPGHGSNFRIFLPQAGPATSATPVSLPVAPESPAPATILLVEDEALVRETAERMVLALGYKVIVAGNAAEATSAFAARLQARLTIELVITDVAMPGGSGPDLVRDLRGRGYRGPVLFMSGYAREGLPAITGEEASDLLRKPFSAQTLAKQISEMLPPPAAAPPVPPTPTTGNLS